MPKRKVKKNFDFKNRYFNSFVLVFVYFCVAIVAAYIFVWNKPVRKVITQSFIGTSSNIRNPKILNVPILMYHYVENVRDARDTIRKSLDITPFVFDNQISTLKSDGYTFLTPKDINSILDNKMTLPKKPVVLSFDDGYEDFYTDVLPVLKKYNVRAVSYVVSGFIDHPNYMTTPELKEVIASGLVEIGCHTVHHADLKDAKPQIAWEEIIGCENEIKQNFGIRPVSFAYPYGEYNEKLFIPLAQAGLKNATTTKPGADEERGNIFEIPRLRPGGRMGEVLTTFLETTSKTAGASIVNP